MDSRPTKNIVFKFFFAWMVSFAVQAQDLQEIYRQALASDPQLRVSRERREAVLQVKRQRVAQLLPQLSATGNETWNHFVTKSSPIPGRAGTNEYFWNNSLNLVLNQPLFHYDLWVQLGQADHQVAEAEALYQAERQNLIMRTAEAYFGILLAFDNLRFTRQTRQAFARQLNQAKQLFKFGQAAITDINEVQAALDRAAADVIQAENQLDNAREALRAIIASYPKHLAALKKQFPIVRPEPEDVEAWTRMALQNNPNIIAAKNRAEAAHKAIQIQFAGHLPQLDVRGNVEFTDSNRSTAVSTESQSISFQLQVPLFAGGGVNAKVREARHNYQAALENLDVQRRQVILQVRNAYHGLLNSIRRIESLRAVLDSNYSALSATQEAFKVGTRTMLDVLIAQRNVLQAEQDYAQARYSYVLNRLRLRQAAGLLKDADILAVNYWLGNSISLPVKTREIIYW